MLEEVVQDILIRIEQSRMGLIWENLHRWVTKMAWTSGQKGPVSVMSDSLLL